MSVLLAFLDACEPGLFNARSVFVAIVFSLLFALPAAGPAIIR